MHFPPVFIFLFYTTTRYCVSYLYLILIKLHFIAHRKHLELLNKEGKLSKVKWTKKTLFLSQKYI